MRRQRRQQTIPEPAQTPASLYASLLAAKEIVETLAGQRGSILDTAVTWNDLLELGLIKPEQLPRE